MTAVSTSLVPGASGTPGLTMTDNFGHYDISPVRQSLMLARRSVISTLRQPPQFVPGLVFPLLLCAVNTASLTKVFRQQGGTSGYLNFVMCSVIIQGVLFSASSAGVDVATDIQNGFLDRLIASPLARPAILIGRIGGSAALGILQATLFMGILALFGARVSSGPTGIVVICMAAMLLAVALGAASSALALRTGSAEAVQSFTPLFFTLIFLSSAFYPKDRMKGWYKQIVIHNPLSWFIEAMRELVVKGWSWSAVGKAIGIPLILAITGIAFAGRMLAFRLRGGE